MLCPECRDEFEPGVRLCPDCQVELVMTLPTPADAGSNSQDSVELLQTADISFLTIAKMLLDSASIPFSVQGEETLGMTTLIPISLFGQKGVSMARIRVPADRYDEASALFDGPELEEGSEPPM